MGNGADLTNRFNYLFQGLFVLNFYINTQLLKDIILPGNNVLSLQFHNDNITSSDLTARVFLSFGIATNSSNYKFT